MDRLVAVGRLADDLDVRLDVEHHAKAGAHERVVVDEQDADAHARQRDPRPHDEAVAVVAVRASSSPP